MTELFFRVVDASTGEHLACRKFADYGADAGAWRYLDVREHLCLIRWVSRMTTEYDRPLLVEKGFAT